ncbi:DUF4169 family protein [Sphingomonas faeni]|uniref:DUF4169 family protein n=1 Tax=Sphingomonas faeni TaxID=185950 RepID=UPI0027D8C36F|nr:DUF4169 family protein [Sphingomonas faeni]
MINLRLARKQRARVTAEQRANENRRLFGRTAAEKAAETRARDRVEKTLDGAHLDKQPPNGKTE